MSELTDIKSKLLKASKRLFWKHGIRRVTVEEICDKADVSKMSFYRHFKNKNDIAEAVLEQIFINSMKQYNRVMQSDDDFRIKVDNLVKLKHKEIKGISEEFINDIYKTKNKALSSKLEHQRQQNQKQVRQDFSQAQENGEIRKDLNIDFMMYMLNDMNQKLLDKELVKHYKSEEVLIMELTNFFFYGILP